MVKASEYQRAYQTSPTRGLDVEYKSNCEYRRLRRSAEMAHRVIDWPDENDEKEVGQGHSENKKGTTELKKQKADDAEKQKTQKTQTSARQLALEAATQTPEKPTRDVSVNGEKQVNERETRSAAKKRAAKAELARKTEVGRKPVEGDGEPATKVKNAEAKQNSDECVTPEIAKLNLRERDENDEKPVPKIDIVELLKGVRAQSEDTESKRKRSTQQKKRAQAQQPDARPASVQKQQSGRSQALFDVELNRPKVKSALTKRPVNLYLYGAGDYSRNGVAVKRTYNVSAPHGAVHETALRAAKRREAERASARRRKVPQRGSARAGQDSASVEQNEFEKRMRRETSQWTTEYRSNFKQHDRLEYARNREVAARCSVLRDDEDLLAIALNPNYDAAKGNGQCKQHAIVNTKVKLNFVPSSARSASARSTSTRSVKSSGSASSRPVE